MRPAFRHRPRQFRARSNPHGPKGWVQGLGVWIGLIRRGFGFTNRKDILEGGAEWIKMLQQGEAWCKG